MHVIGHSFAWVSFWQDNSGVKSHVFLIFVSIFMFFFFAFQSLFNLHFIMSPWPARHMFLFFFLVRMLSSIWRISHWYMMLVWFFVLFTHALSSGSDVIDYAWQINDYFTNKFFWFATTDREHQKVGNILVFETGGQPKS